ncbi:unnamed protein product [Mytilus coruscus]|uniref:G-protein coupled receptors family 1 profile domain-containing protein n=1 Tax=Mytilus coruscus TaxID=42192 RepID=A0A6J8D104_MYTCO|nr:unnamed protein product [Mytilus coruscus]
MQGLALADGLTVLCTYGFEPIFNLHYEEIGNSTSKSLLQEVHQVRFFFTAKIEEMKRLVALKFPYCVMHYCLSNLVDIFHLVSILLTTCLGLQKFLAVACPIWSKTQITIKRSAIVCVTCFLLTLTVSMPRLFVVSLSRGKEGDICLVSEPHQTIQKYVLAYYQIFYAIILVFAVVTMLISTCFIIFTLCRRKRVRGNVAASRAEKKSCILIVCVMAVFFFSEVPRIFVSATLFSTYRSNLDRTNAALHLTNTKKVQTHLECLVDFLENFNRFSYKGNLSCNSDYNEIPSWYKVTVTKELDVFLGLFNIYFTASNFRKVADLYFKDQVKQVYYEYLIDDQIDLNLLKVTETAKSFQQNAFDLAVELYCANASPNIIKTLLKRFSYLLDNCGIVKLFDPSLILGSTPYSEPMNYILNIVSGQIDITLEHLKLLTEILKFSMIIGCGSNFLIYIIMSKKLRNALKKTFRCGDNQDARADALEMQIRR